jgi:NAD-dependent SIR2 family protein deacetylase
MSTYKIFCDSCEAEFSITPLAGSDARPTNCAYCGSNIAEETITEKDEELPDGWMDELIDDEWSSEDDR